MRARHKCESCTEASSVIDDSDLDLVSKVIEEVLAKDLDRIRTIKKLKEETIQCYINHT